MKGTILLPFVSPVVTCLPVPRLFRPEAATLHPFLSRTFIGSCHGPSKPNHGLTRLLHLLDWEELAKQPNQFNKEPYETATIFVWLGLMLLVSQSVLMVQTYTFPGSDAVFSPLTGEHRGGVGWINDGEVVEEHRHSLRAWELRGNAHGERPRSW
jgi:hypothetical protein